VPGGARVCFSAQDKLYVTAVTDYGVYDPGKNVFSWTDVKPARLNAVAVDPEGKLLALGTQAGEILLYDATTNRSLDTLQGHYWWVNSLAFSPDGKQLASGGTDMTVQVWDVAKFLPK
jgi:WD40 repeat protein